MLQSFINTRYHISIHFHATMSAPAVNIDSFAHLTLSGYKQVELLLHHSTTF